MARHTSFGVVMLNFKHVRLLIFICCSIDNVIDIIILSLDDVIALIIDLIDLIYSINTIIDQYFTAALFHITISRSRYIIKYLLLDYMI